MALLIDADNSPAVMIGRVLAELEKEGAINIRRAYGDWNSPHLTAWARRLNDFAIQPIQQVAYTKGKNATDAALIIDAIDLLYTQQIDGFAIVSSDSDFTPLVLRLRTNGVKVYGFGEQKTPKPFVSACSKFLYLEDLRHPKEAPAAIPAKPTPPKAAPPKAATVEKAAPKNPTSQVDPAILRADTDLVNLLRKAVENAPKHNGWANLSAVSYHISRQVSFDIRNYGYARLSRLFQAIGLFDVRNNGCLCQVRDLRHEV